MATKKLGSGSVSIVEIKSFKDAGYQGAKAGDTIKVIAGFVLDKCPDFPESLGDEDKAKLYEGYQVRYAEITPVKFYNTEWVPCEEGMKGAVAVTLDYCMSFSSAEFGKLRDSNPIQHSIVKEIRDKFSTYRSERFKALVSAVNKLRKEREGSVTRKANKDYAEYVNATFDAMLTRNKSATARGDATAIKPELLNKAIAAFKAVLTSAT